MLRPTRLAFEGPFVYGEGLSLPLPSRALPWGDGLVRDPHALAHFPSCRIPLACEGEVRLDEVARKLSGLADGVLSAFCFEQTQADANAPSWDDADASEGIALGLLRLRARGTSRPRPRKVEIGGPCSCLHGEADGYDPIALDVIALDRGPFVDLPAVLGLLNSLLVVLCSERRFVVRRARASDAEVLCAAPAQLAHAVERGLLQLELPDLALTRGWFSDAT